MKTLFEQLSNFQLYTLLVTMAVGYALLIYGFIAGTRNQKKEKMWTIPPAADVRLSLDWDCNDARENEL